MRVSRIRVRNIRSYLDATLELAPGTTLLVGDVGAGKTSLLYAVEMALFGTAEIDATFLVRHGASEAEVEVTLEDGEHRYEILRSFRRVRRKGKETFEPGRIAFRQDGATTSYSATELRQRVIELLGFRDNPNPRAHSDLWRWAVYIPQERMREILSAPPKERLETVRRALGVERYRIAAENAKEVARDLRQTASALRESAELLRRFTEDHAAATAEIRRVDELRRAGDDRRRHLEEERTRAAEEAIAAQGALHRLDADRRVRRTLQEEDDADLRALEIREQTRSERARESVRVTDEIGEQEAVAGRTTELRKGTIVAAEEVARLRKEVESRASAAGLLSVARARIAELERRLKTLGLEEEHTRTQVDRARERLAGSGTVSVGAEPTPPTPHSLADLEHHLLEARAQETRAREAAALAHRSLTELEELVAEGVCPRCGQTVHSTEFATHREEAETAVGLADDEVRATELSRQRRESLRQDRDRFEREHERWAEAVRRQADLRSTLATAEDASRRTETALVECRVSLEALRKEEEELTPAEGELRRRRAGLAAADQALTEARTRLENAERAHERAGSLRERLRSLSADAERDAAETDALRTRRTARAARLTEVDSALAREPEVRTTADDAARRREAAESAWQMAAQELTRWATQLESLHERKARAEQGQRERERRLETAEATEAKAAWLSTGFHDAVLTMEARVLERAQADFEHHFQRYFAALIDDPGLVAVTDSSFSPAAEIRGVWTPAEALSGGERTSLALAYRLALARVVRSAGHLRLDSLLLDEPTDGFSPEQVESMGQLLEELALPQVLLVSHERELESVAQRVVWVEKENGHTTLRGPGTGVPAEPTAAEPT
ncbi:MAG TPA: SMC family ATPase [Thermoplasmata archaeon]|nr:SMC family ATPase [Thermoplasmata archaeon]